ncbi:TetR/AcrR family transcriptional regulator [Pseudanabaena sp. UWO311]|uniref:TetR/AcrR family transcriptional regulator n=1 Tax=Pseudanabaena sp. UWO311 TaxID=2487337 RepID=UPI00115A9A3A|nr:TetR/AcrR family transcriptional regulator [Pseudanabaena sp. UWO311]TYQ24318.1 TetR/AcrR family transcriptional regulator [Pseudanabaena sp. UWO311]
MESSKPSQPNRPEKTAAILDGAMRVFLDQGYAGTTMDKVASAAGVSKPTVYNHFQDKEALFNALMKKLVLEKEWAKCPLGLQNFSSEPPNIVLKRIANEVLDNCTTSSEQMTFIRLVIGESGRFPELSKSFVTNMDKPIIDALTNYFTSQNIPTPEVAARMFMGTLVFFLMTSEVMGGKDIIPIERDYLVDNLINMIMKQSA